MTKISDKLLDDVWAIVDHEICSLQEKSFGELRVLIEQPRLWTLEIREKSVQFGAFAQPHDNNRLAVIVEGRRNFILGISRVAAKGFYKSSDEIVTPFVEIDIYAHGY